MAGLLFGFDTAVIAGVTAALRDLYHLDAAGGWPHGVVRALGHVAGRRAGRACSAAASVRVAGLRLSALFYVLSGFGCALAWSWWALVSARFLCGVAIGASSVLAPIYLAEIAPAHRRGLIVGMWQVNIVVGILVAYLSNAAVGAFHLGAGEWRWKLGLTALPAMLFFALMLVVPNSPRWLALKGRLTEARAALEALGTARDTGVDALTFISDERSAGLGALWTYARRPLFLAIILGALSQLTGINAILYFSNDIFGAAGFSKASGDLQSIAIGVANLAATLVAMSVIDRYGRRPLLLTGTVGMIAMLGVAAAVFYGHAPQPLLLPVLILFIASFAISQGAVSWVYISEIFPTRLRAAGQGIGAGTIWLFDAIVADQFPGLAAYSKGLPFLIFFGFMVFQLLFVWRFLPETKGVSLEALEARLATV